MNISPWRSSLNHAFNCNSIQPHSRYFQLATVQADGRPANRTVVFRGFLGDTNQIKIIIDNRSQKYEQILHLPWGEICWYFTETREQFRLAGELTLVDAHHPDPELQKARQSTWQDLSNNARLQYAWEQPGEARASQETFTPPPPDPVNPLENFCLLLLDPVRVDHLQLKGDPQNRRFYLRGEYNVWSSVEVNP